MENWQPLNNDSCAYSQLFSCNISDQRTPEGLLFDLSAPSVNQSFPLRMRLTNVDPWYTQDIQQPQMNMLNHPRKNGRLVFGPKKKNCGTQLEMPSNGKAQKQSIIPRLKHLLYELQSPQKKKKHKEQQEKGEKWNCAEEACRGPVSNTVEVLGKKSFTKSHYIRIGRSSREKNRVQSSSWKQRGTMVRRLQGARQVTEHLSCVKEARRRRTLQHLLF